MHPGGIIVLLLAAIAGVLLFRPRSRLTVADGPARRRRDGANPRQDQRRHFRSCRGGLGLRGQLSGTCPTSLAATMVEVGFVALPLLLMSSNVGETWVRHYAFHVSVAALAVVIALRARCTGRRDSKELWWLGGGLLVVGVAGSLAIFATGTSPSELIEGIIMLPLRVPSAFSVPLVLPGWIYVLDLLPLLGALGYWYVVRNRAARPSRIWTAGCLGLQHPRRRLDGVLGDLFDYGFFADYDALDPDGRAAGPCRLRLGRADPAAREARRGNPVRAHTATATGGFTGVACLPCRGQPTVRCRPCCSSRLARSASPMGSVGSPSVAVARARGAPPWRSPLTAATAGLSSPRRHPPQAGTRPSSDRIPRCSSPRAAGRRTCPRQPRRGGRLPGDRCRNRRKL